MSRHTTGTGLALVTGAASGIGAEVARRVAARGFRVIAVDRNQTLADAAAARTAADAIGVACDLSDAAAVESLCERIRHEWSDELQLLICNAGVIVPADVAELEQPVADLHLDVMLRAPIHMIRAAVPGFLKRGSGHVLATVSMGGIIPMPGSAVYSAAKFGMRAFLAALYAEVKQHGIGVSGIYPNAVDTPMLRKEAASGGSALNFVGAVRSVDDVADAYDRALDTGKLEFYVPYSDSLSGRLVATKLALIPKLLPLLNRIGERGRRRYLASPTPDWDYGASTATADHHSTLKKPT